MISPLAKQIVPFIALFSLCLAGACADDTSDAGDPAGEGSGAEGSSSEGEVTPGVYLEAREDCPQAGGFFNVANPDNFIDYNGDGQSNAEIFGDEDLSPTLSVSCSGDEVSVTSNGVVNYDYSPIDPDGVGGYIGDAQSRAPDVNEQTFTFPSSPEVASSPSALPTEGTVAVLSNGIQIYGPNEALVDKGADPVPHGLLDYCNGHVNVYHHHGHPACFFSYPTLGGASSLLQEGVAGQVVGYALDGFPIYAPYACSDEACSSVLEVKSSWDYDTSATWTIDSNGLSGDCATDDAGGYSDNYAWSCNVFTAQKDDTAEHLYADECNGRTQPDGSYAYYATKDFPYFLGCFKGTATNAGAGGNNNGGGPPGGGPPPM